MRYRPLGRTGMTVSELGLGCASYWGRPAFDEAMAIRLVHEAIDRGVTFFDTGSSYAQGEAEPRLGRALTGRAGADLVVATKAGTAPGGGGRVVRDFSVAGVTASVEQSLRRLGLEALPLLQLHGPAAQELTEPFLDGLEALRRRGLVRSFGVNSFDPAVIEQAIGLPLIDVVMVDYNVLRPEREPLIERAAEAGKAVLAGMPLAMGHTNLQVLKLGERQDRWYALRGLVRHPADVLKGAKFAFLNRTRGMTGAQAALAYVLANPDVACAVTGTTRLEHLVENLAVSGRKLPFETLSRIRATQAA